jgi:outer membrane protein OmpA-like peptidoglycan-associated protein
MKITNASAPILAILALAAFGCGGPPPPVAVTVATPAPPPPPVVVTVAAPPPPAMTGAELNVPGSIEFEVDQDQLKNNQATAACLQAMVVILQNAKNLQKIRVEGHTDSDGNFQHNMELSERRAGVVIRWLVDHGVDGGRLHGVGCASKDPLWPNTTAENKQKNRRTEFDIELIDGHQPDGFTQACAPNPAQAHH